MNASLQDFLATRLPDYLDLLRQMVSINSFSEMVSVSTQRGVVQRWPPRSGQQVLL
jgi:type VI protein secretion system component VasA